MPSNPHKIHKIKYTHFYTHFLEFRIWLFRKYNKYALHEEISQLGKYFKEFKSEWNHKKLPNEYYNGFSDFEIEKVKRTDYIWEFTTRMTDDEKLEISRLQDLVTKLTNTPYDSSKDNSRIIDIKPSEDDYDKELKKEREIEREKKLAKQYESSLKNTLDELVPPPAAGHEKHVEKKKLSNKMRKEYENKEGLVELSDNFILGNEGDVDFSSLKQKMKQQKEKKTQRQLDLIKEAKENEEKEKNRLNEFAKSLGIEKGRKITIKERDS